MSCSKQHGAQAFIGFIADSTGETVSQQDWHDLREMANDLGGDMSKERVSPEEAIATLKALDAHLNGKKNAKASKVDVDAQFAEMTAQSKKRGEEMRKSHQESMDRIRTTLSEAADTFTAPQKATAPKAAAPSPKVAKAEQELLAAKVTRGTITVIRMFIAIGVKPLLNMIRERREETRLMKAEARKLERAMKHIRDRRNGYW